MIDPETARQAVQAWREFSSDWMEIGKIRIVAAGDALAVLVPQLLDQLDASWQYQTNVEPRDVIANALLGDETYSPMEMVLDLENEAQEVARRVLDALTVAGWRIVKLERGGVIDSETARPTPRDVMVTSMDEWFGNDMDLTTTSIRHNAMLCAHLLAALTAAGFQVDVIAESDAESHPWVSEIERGPCITCGLEHNEAAWRGVVSQTEPRNAWQ